MKISHHIFVSVFFVCALKEMCSGYDPLDEPRGLLYRSMAHPERTRLRPEVKLRNILAESANRFECCKKENLMPEICQKTCQLDDDEVMVTLMPGEPDNDEWEKLCPCSPKINPAMEKCFNLTLERTGVMEDPRLRAKIKFTCPETGGTP